MDCISRFAKELERSMRAVPMNAGVSLQKDGGMDVSRNKILMTCMALDRLALIHSMVDRSVSA